MANQKFCLDSQQGAGLVVIIMMILAIGMMAGTVAINMTLVFDEEATILTQKKLKKVALSISSTNFNSPPENMRYYEQDVGALPSSLNDLVTRPVAVGTCYMDTADYRLSGWCGPYWVDKFSGENRFVDFWGSNLILDTSARTVRSIGPDRTDDSGGDDDLVQNF